MPAYEMNGERLTYGHGAPLRLYNEIQHGFKQVKWLAGIDSPRHSAMSVEGTADITPTTSSSVTVTPSRTVRVSRRKRRGRRRRLRP
jgi:DMSO/TMAO reductase YedYZ molybdopterin-dependent catalytic subunit